MRLCELKTPQSTIDSVKELWKEYKSAKKISAILDIPISQVHKILERHYPDREKMYGSRKTPEWLINKIKELWDNKLQAKEIVKEIPGITLPMVNKILLRYYPEREKRSSRSFKTLS